MNPNEDFIPLSSPCDVCPYGLYHCDECPYGPYGIDEHSGELSGYSYMRDDV